MIRGRWTDVSLDWVDYQEARVEVLDRDNRRLRREIDFLRKVLQDANHDREIVIADDGTDLPSVLVRTMPVPPPPRPEMRQ